MIKLPNVTIWAACWSGERQMLERTVRVLDYCRHIIQAAEFIYFVNVARPYILNTQRWYRCIPMGYPMDWQDWNSFVNREAPKRIDTEFAMCVHEDGFPIAPQLWEPAFLEYDYIGAPWLARECTGFVTREQAERNDLIVGNGGFFIWSQRMMQAALEMPHSPQEREIASDVYVCRAMRDHFEHLGMTFAPPDVAARFSTEQTHKYTPSFGFHGRRDASDKYRQGWAQIEAMGL